jgi:hypothetical protein
VVAQPRLRRVEHRRARDVLEGVVVALHHALQ